MSVVSRPKFLRRVWIRNWAVVGLLLAVGFWGVLSWRHYRDGQRRELLISAVSRAGGIVNESAPITMADRAVEILETLGGSPGPRSRPLCELILRSPAFDDLWMQRADQLRGLPVTSVIVMRANLSADGLSRLVAAHDVEVITAPGIPLTDAHIAQFGSQPLLSFLNLDRTNVSDRSISRLRPQHLRSLYVGGTDVTAEGLEQLRGSPQLAMLGLDGRQLAELPDDFFVSLPRLIDLKLIGPEVTDEHLARVAGMSQIKILILERTSVTTEAASSFKQQRPDCALGMPATGNEVIPW